MSDQPMGPGWWQASDGRWYPPEARAVDSTPTDASSIGEDWVAVMLEVAGWLVVGGYAFTGIAAGVLGWTEYNSVAVGLIVFALGAVQGLLLVAFGRALGYLHTLASITARR